VATGGPTAAVLALHNPLLRVSVLDRDEGRIQRWKSAHLPIHEPGLHQAVRIVRDGATRTNPHPTLRDTTQENISAHQANLTFTTNSKESISKADMIFLAVNTPTKTFGQGAGRATNMQAVDGAVRDIAKHAKDSVIIVEKSTVPCGTARRISSSVSVPSVLLTDNTEGNSFALSGRT
jgi:UDPglucose 6-dehydrogenase